MTEKHITSGNNILSQSEYDAMLSHLYVLRTCTAGSWDFSGVEQLLGGGPGIALDFAEVDGVLADISQLDILGGTEAEANRVKTAMAAIFGR